MIMNDKQIQNLIENANLIENWEGSCVSGASYDARLGSKMQIAKHSHAIVDIRNPHNINLEDLQPQICLETGGAFFVIPANSFVLAHTIEKFNMPCDIIGFVFNKSTFARVGNNQPTTSLEAGWAGILTLEIHNHLPQPIKLWVGQSVCKIHFLQIDTPNKQYNGKYQNQSGLTGAK